MISGVHDLGVAGHGYYLLPCGERGSNFQN